METKSLYDQRNSFSTARINEYIEWLNGYLNKGGKPTHYYDYPFARPAFLSARRDFTTDGECGSHSRHIIVRRQHRYKGGELGHNNIFHLHDFSVLGGWVPIYNDSDFLKLGLDEFIRAEKQRQRKNQQEREARMRGKSRRHGSANWRP
jgi:hypothetical protein